MHSYNTYIAYDLPTRSLAMSSLSSVLRIANLYSHTALGLVSKVNRKIIKWLCNISQVSKIGIHITTYNIVFCVGGSKQKECFIYHEVASVLYEK